MQSNNTMYRALIFLRKGVFLPRSAPMAHNGGNKSGETDLG